MLSLTGRKMVVIGGSRSVGRQIVERGVHSGAHVLAVARKPGPLTQLAEELSGIKVLALDAAHESAPAIVFRELRPDILVLCAGALPPNAPLHEQSWEEFDVNWEADVKIAFHFCKAALSLPLASGSSIILISSGAALAGSPLTGGYAGAKRTQLFIANYAQKEADRLRLGLRFTALAPRMMPGTELGQRAVAAYSRYLGISGADFIKSMDVPPSPTDIAAAVLEVAGEPSHSEGKVYVVSGRGLEAVSSA